MAQNNDIRSTSITLPAFRAPGPGEWKIIDHIARPGTRCFTEYYYSSMENGWNEEASEIGLLNRVLIREVNGFMYYQMKVVESEPEFFEMCEKNEKYWEQKRYFDSLERWDELVKPNAINQLTAMQKIKLADLSESELIFYINYCFSLTKQMVKNHHLFTYSSFIPIGDFIFQVCKWTKKEPADILNVLVRKTPNQIYMAFDYPQITQLLDSLKKNTTALYLLSKAEREPEDASEVLSRLMNLDQRIRRGLEFLLDHFGYRIVNGYDIATETFIERPDLLLKSVKSLLRDNISGVENNSRNARRIGAIRDLVPDARKPLFDKMLQDTLQMERLRDERGFYSDLWAIGILRHIFLEAGRRLVKKGVIATPEFVLDASTEELISLLVGKVSVSVEDLEQRARYRSSFSVADAPAVLGESLADAPYLSNLPSSIARTMTGLMTAVELAVDPKHHQPLKKERLIGLPASHGVVDGIARVITSDTQIKDIKRGEILVVHQSTAAFNIIFPVIGGVIAEYGGVLSHPAILAREYGIPCIVGCSGAMKHIRTGMHIHLDGSKGEAKITSHNGQIRQKLDSLKCDYFGPMKGRNRNRVFNHAGVVSNRLRIVDGVRKSLSCKEILRKHFYEEISTEDAVKKIIEHAPIEISEHNLENFVQRYHIEFHPCDACNLHCSGCTYFQDLPTKPASVSFPIDSMAQICSVIQPKAVTMVGGGEPALYKSKGKKLGDLICALGNGEYGSTPAIGIISNGTLWIPGNPNWHRYVDWIRYSLDASSTESYITGKGKDFFDTVIDNVMRTLTDTTIPLVSIGFLYNPSNIVEASSLISNFAKRTRNHFTDYLDRFSIQFRPWRMPVGRPAINEQVLSEQDIEDAAVNLFKLIEHDPCLEEFIRQNTNIAVNLLCAGAREKVYPFSECYFGLAKTVVRANGALYPCFRVAAAEEMDFYCGNIISDTALKVALRELYVHIVSVKKVCIPEFEKCLFCVFNNMLESGLKTKIQIQQEITEDYFF